MSAKEQEIKAIQALIEMNGYFAEFFKKDSDQMIENIKSDFPIEYDTHFHHGVDEEKQKNKELKKQHEDKVDDLCGTLLCAYEETKNERLYEKALEELGIDNLIKLKRCMGLSLTSKEIDYLVAKL